MTTHVRPAGHAGCYAARQALDLAESLLKLIPLRIIASVTIWPSPAGNAPQHRVDLTYKPDDMVANQIATGLKQPAPVLTIAARRLNPALNREFGLELADLCGVKPGLADGSSSQGTAAMTQSPMDGRALEIASDARESSRYRCPSGLPSMKAIP